MIQNYHKIIMQIGVCNLDKSVNQLQGWSAHSIMRIEDPKKSTNLCLECCITNTPCNRQSHKQGTIGPTSCVPELNAEKVQTTIQCILLKCLHINTLYNHSCRVVDKEARFLILSLQMVNMRKACPLGLQLTLAS